jgi:hypothetical protein
VRKVTRLFYRKLNNLLARVGLQLVRADWDFESRLVGPRWEGALFESLSSQISIWLGSQTTIPDLRHFDVEAEVRGFYHDWIRGPFRQPFGGSRFNNALWLDIIAKAYSPEVIIDSGTFQGASAWALSRGAPDAQVLSFDINLSNLLWRSEKVEFREQDWTAMSLALSHRRNLAYFDDHVDQARRLLEAANLGVSVAIFDDDFSVTSFASMAHDGASLPKVEFVLDETLADGEELTWIARSKLQRWRVDRAYLDLAKKTIKATERLPNLSMITGIWQTPYRICTMA